MNTTYIHTLQKYLHDEYNLLTSIHYRNIYMMNTTYLQPYITEIFTWWIQLTYSHTLLKYLHDEYNLLTAIYYRNIYTMNTIYLQPYITQIFTRWIQLTYSLTLQKNSKVWCVSVSAKQLLVSGQPYVVRLELEMPESYINRNVGKPSVLLLCCIEHVNTVHTGTG